jgi:putative DNA primase/helicase
LACSTDNASARGVLTFQGVQGLGKTKWLKTLVPQHLNLVTDGVILKLDDKDSIKSATSFWIVELGELDSTFKKSDIAALKAFITKESDLMRLPYARKDSHFKRRTVYFASVNEEQFLQDKTGNSRYWTIKVKALDSNHNIDMQQVWAQVYETMYLTGETHYLTAEEEKKLSLNNTESTSIDPIEELVQSSYKWESDRSVWRWETATNVLLELGYNKPTRGDAMTASNIIKLLNGNQSRRVHSGRQLLVPYMINKRYYGE